ncbi:MAG: LysR family transcriptional regulator [Akkermansiaceae bacterium]|nr:LysR family transcriptional regulator [Akkermansiaceae bacterium]
MDLRKLNYFIEVAQRGSITKAAAALRMTQPALSRQIRTFEQEMGWTLLDRGARSIRLTREGEVVLREGRRIQKSVDGGLKRMRQELSGAVIRVGYAPSLGGNLLKAAMGCFVQRHGKARIELRDLSSEEMLSQIRSGELDLMIGVRTDTQDLDWQDLDRKGLLMAVPKDHDLARRRTIQVGEVAGERLLLLSRHDYPEYWESVGAYFQDAGIDAKVAGEFDGIESLGLALQAGLGMALVAENSDVGKGVRLVKMKPEPQGVRVAVGWRNDRALGPITAAFVEELKLHKR